MVEQLDENNNSDLGTAFAVASLAAAAAGIWSLFKNDESSNNQYQTDVQTEFNRATQFVQQGQYQQAIPLFFSILQKNLAHAQTYSYLAWIYAIHKYELDQALAFANRAIELGQTPLDRTFFIDTLAEVHYHREEIDQAINFSFQFLQSMQNLNQVIYSPVTYFRLAWCYYSKQDFNGVYGFLQQASQINSLGAGDYATTGDICHAMGFFRLEQELYDEAIGHFNNAKSQYETSVNVAQNQGIDDNLFRFKLSMTINCIGSAFASLENYQNSWQAYQSAYNSSRCNPYPPINLALLAARQRDKKTMFYWLGIGVPLIVDNPPFLQAEHLISSIISDIDFEAYRDDVLGMLLSNNKISVSDYKRFLNDWHSRQRQPINFNQQNIYGSVGAAAGNVEGSFISQPQGI